MFEHRLLTSTRLILASLLLLSASVAAQERPLPDLDVFMPEVRKHLQTDQSLQRSYSYVETRREQKLNEQGRPVDESVKVFESYPGLPGEGRWERLIAENGKPVPASELEKRDLERQKKAQEYVQRQTAQPDKERAKQRREWEKDRREMAELVDDVFRVYDVRMLRRERIDGHDTIAFSLTPRPRAEPRTRDGSIMRHFTAQAWVSESDYELVRVEVEAIDTVSFGLGLLARIHKGARMSFLRRKVNGEVWLPATASYVGTARVGLFKTIRRGGSSEYSNYRKFTVDTSATYRATP